MLIDVCAHRIPHWLVTDLINELFDFILIFSIFASQSARIFFLSDFLMIPKMQSFFN